MSTVRTNDSGTRPIRIGFVSRFSPSDRSALSGMPYGFWHGLQRQGADLVDLSVNQTSSTNHGPWPRIVRRLDHSLGRQLKRATQSAFRSVKGHFFPKTEYRQTVSRASKLSKAVQRRLEQEDVDIIFGVCMSTMLFDLQTQVPIVYSSDTTARLINTQYPAFQNRSPAYHRACDDIEHRAMAKCHVFVGACQPTTQSAMRSYG
ncbi:MAG: hypothetical protein AAF989_00260, partial [Planctomycetota bacterium]